MNESSNNMFFPMAHGIALITINAIVCVLGSLGNFLVCLAIATNSHLRRASSYPLFSLASHSLWNLSSREHSCTADFKASLSLAYFILTYLSCATSVLHMVAISLDRFVAVVFPLRHKNFMEKFGLKVMLIVSWSILIFQLILLFVLWCVIPSAFYSAATFLFLGTRAFSHFFIFIFYFLIVVFLLRYKRKRKQLSRTRNVSVKLNFPARRFVFLVRWL